MELRPGGGAACRPEPLPFDDEPLPPPSIEPERPVSFLNALNIMRSNFDCVRSTQRAFIWLVKE
jgi:hypothetical protein